MWIIMDGTYTGVHGCYVKGVKYDLPNDIVKDFPSGVYKKCRAPWDEHKDDKAVKRMQLEAEVTVARKKFDKLVAEFKLLETKMQGLQQTAEQKLAEEQTAKHSAAKLQVEANAARKKANSKKATKGDGKRAAKLTAIAESARANVAKAGFEANKANAELNLIKAELNLIAFGGGQAKEEADFLAKKLKAGKKANRLAEDQKAKEEAKAKESEAENAETKPEQSAKIAGTTESQEAAAKDVPDTEGQAVSIGQDGE